MFTFLSKSIIFAILSIASISFSSKRCKYAAMSSSFTLAKAAFNSVISLSDSSLIAFIFRAELFSLAIIYLNKPFISSTVGISFQSLGLIKLYARRAASPTGNPQPNNPPPIFNPVIMPSATISIFELFTAIRFSCNFTKALISPIFANTDCSIRLGSPNSRRSYFLASGSLGLSMRNSTTSIPKSGLGIGSNSSLAPFTLYACASKSMPLR